jgi:uncharacterized protein (DUF488 family)
VLADRPRCETRRNFLLVEIFTIGVYGRTESNFFGAVAAAGIDTFCDIRNRRGMRGHLYAFANSVRLQTKLDSMNIQYFHFRELSPSAETREAQRKTDEADGVQKRSRLRLGEEFKALYQMRNLCDFNSRSFIDRLGSRARRVVLFCVEADPMACHRSLLAERFREDLGASVTHL